MEEMVTPFLSRSFFLSYLCQKLNDMAKMNYKSLLWLVSVLLLMSCDCPWEEERWRTSTKGNTFYADMLIGTWQCYHPMVVGGVEFKQITFMSGGKADIIMAKKQDTDWYTETYNYTYYDNTLRFSRGRNNLSFTIDDFLFPELYLRDSFGRYTMAKRR